jgi:GxxExxY protein
LTAEGAEDAEMEMDRTKDFPLKDETYRVLGACFEVYKEKGCGFLEPVYHECLDLEFRLQSIPAVHEPKLSLAYKGQFLRQTYDPDFLCFDQLVLELKAVKALADEHRSQVHNYLKATGFVVGLLVNFGHFPGLEYERIVRSKSSSA